MIFAALLHLIAGMIAGSIFSVQTLLLLIALVMAECVSVAVILSLTSGLWALQLLIAVQLGYLAGIYLRSVVEARGAAIAKPGVQPRRRS